MHELGIVFYIIRDVKEAAEANHVEHVSAADKEDLLRGSELRINIIPAVTHCEGCGREYETVRYGRTCPSCSSGNTYLLRGNEVEIKEIEVPNN